MSMPSRLPMSDWSKARNAFVKLVESDPELKAAGCRIVQLDGDPLPQWQSGPTLAQTPWIRIQTQGSPERWPAHWETEGQHSAPLIMDVQIATSGFRESDFLDLWGAIVKAIYPGVPGSERRLAKERIMIDSRICQITMTRVPTPLPPPPGKPAMLIGSGAFRIDISISTKE